MGYTNKRVIVFDAETGAYRRHWGAYGARPEDTKLPPDDPAAPPAKQFHGPVHGITLSRDGFIYVTDCIGNRVQVFRKDPAPSSRKGSSRRKTLDAGAADRRRAVDRSAAALGVYQRRLRFKVWILRRDTLATVGSFGIMVFLAQRCPRRQHGGGSALYILRYIRGRRVQRFKSVSGGR